MFGLHSKVEYFWQKLTDLWGLFTNDIELKYVGVQSWKAMHLPTLDIRVAPKGHRAMKWKIQISFKTGLVLVSPC